MASQILHHLQIDKHELSILLTGDEDIHHINVDYRGIDKPTDVIAFAMNEGVFSEINDNILGDVVISLDTAKRQASERGVDVMDEVVFLLIHGILHLLGYDHEVNDRERRKMEDKERELLNQLGIYL